MGTPVTRVRRANAGKKVKGRQHSTRRCQPRSASATRTTAPQQQQLCIATRRGTCQLAVVSRHPVDALFTASTPWPARTGSGSSRALSRACCRRSAHWMVDVAQDSEQPRFARRTRQRAGLRAEHDALSPRSTTTRRPRASTGRICGSRARARQLGCADRPAAHYGDRLRRGAAYCAAARRREAPS